MVHLLIFIPEGQPLNVYFRNMVKKIFLMICLSCLLLDAIGGNGLNDSSSIKDIVFTKLGIKTDTIYNPVLYRTVIDWMGTRYQYGGRTKGGIDCSDFTAVLYKEAYNIALSGGSGDIFKKVIPLDKSELKEGDMVFFKINRGRISHVGVYLADNKFAHATTHAGVVVSDLNEAYYKRYFFRGGMLDGKVSAAAPIVPLADERVAFSKTLGFSIDTIINLSLYQSVKAALEKPRSRKLKKKKDKDGAVLCSNIYNAAYGIKLIGPASKILKSATPLTKEELLEGDLVFFKSPRKKTVKVGIYLTKNKFVHLSAGKDAVVSDLNDPAYKKVYYRGGRFTKN